MTSPLSQPARSFLCSPIEVAVLGFAQADYHWRTLSADRQQWTDPEKQRGLAAAFLRYHAAKLALESVHLPR